MVSIQIKGVVQQKQVCIIIIVPFLFYTVLTSTCHRKTQSSVELTLSSFGSNKLLIPYIFNNAKQTIN